MPAQLIAYAAHAFGQRPRARAAVPHKPEDDAQEDLRPAARPDRPRLLPVQAEHDRAPHRAAHGAAPDRAAGRLRALPPAEPGGGRGAVLRSADRRHQLLPRPRGLRGSAARSDPALCSPSKPAGAPIRVWVPGCSTGEEAYSIAILLQEHLDDPESSLSSAGVRHRSSTAAPSSGPAPASIRPASPPTSRRNGWRAFSIQDAGRQGRIASRRSSATC